MSRRPKKYKGRDVVVIGGRRVPVSDAIHADGSVTMGPNPLPPYLPNPADQKAWLEKNIPRRRSKSGKR